jgi:hypothetical protein
MTFKWIAEDPSAPERPNERPVELPSRFSSLPRKRKTFKWVAYDPFAPQKPDKRRKVTKASSLPRKGTTRPTVPRDIPSGAEDAELDEQVPVGELEEQILAAALDEQDSVDEPDEQKLREETEEVRAASAERLRKWKADGTKVPAILRSLSGNEVVERLKCFETRILHALTVLIDTAKNLDFKEFIAALATDKPMTLGWYNFLRFADPRKVYDSSILPATPLSSRLILGGPMTKAELESLSPEWDQDFWGVYIDIVEGGPIQNVEGMDPYVGSGTHRHQGVTVRPTRYERVSAGDLTPDQGMHERLLAKDGVKSRTRLIAGYDRFSTPRVYVLLFEQLTSILTGSINLPLGHFLTQSCHDMLVRARHHSLPRFSWTGQNRAAQVLQASGGIVGKKLCYNCGHEGGDTKYLNINPGLPKTKIACHPCYCYFMRTGVDRPERLWYAFSTWAKRVDSPEVPSMAQEHDGQADPHN